MGDRHLLDVFRKQQTWYIRFVVVFAQISTQHSLWMTVLVIIFSSKNTVSWKKGLVQLVTQADAQALGLLDPLPWTAEVLSAHLILENILEDVYSFQHPGSVKSAFASPKTFYDRLFSMSWEYAGQDSLVLRPWLTWSVGTFICHCFSIKSWLLGTCWALACSYCNCPDIKKPSWELPQGACFGNCCHGALCVFVLGTAALGSLALFSKESSEALEF